MLSIESLDKIVETMIIIFLREKEKYLMRKPFSFLLVIIGIGSYSLGLILDSSVHPAYTSIYGRYILDIPADRLSPLS